MHLYKLNRRQILPITMATAWSFFSDPRNLALITPPKLGLRVRSELTDHVHPGMVISYHLNPIFGVRLTWVTEITHVNEPNQFVDEQRFGPYRFWHHLHEFRMVAGGVEVTDTIHYMLRFGLIGKLAHGLIVRRNLEHIFDFRFSVLEDRFGRQEA